MKELLDNPGFIALVGTLFGGAGLEVIRRFMDRKQRKNDDAAKIREELRLDMQSLRQQMTDADLEEKRLEAEIERWKGLYYDLRDEKQAVVTELKILTEKLKSITHQDDFGPGN